MCNPSIEDSSKFCREDGRVKIDRSAIVRAHTNWWNIVLPAGWARRVPQFTARALIPKINLNHYKTENGMLLD